MKKVTLSIEVNDQSDAPMADGKIEIFKVQTLKIAGTGANNLAAFQDAMARGGAEFLEDVIKMPGQVLAMLGMKGGSH